MSVCHLLGYGYHADALRELVIYGAGEVRSGRASSLRFGVLESQKVSLQTLIDEIAPEVLCELTSGEVTPVQSRGTQRRACPCCGRL